MPRNVSITESSRSPTGVWSFFDRVHDVTNLDPAEEQNIAWEAHLDPGHDLLEEDTDIVWELITGEERVVEAGDVVGMVVVDTFPSTPFINRIAVIPPVRKHGIGRTLLAHLEETYDELACRVNESNDNGLALVESYRFTEVESRFRELHRFELHTEDAESS